MEQAHPATGLRERKKRATRRTIVRVALELFDERGFDATSIPAIAEAADVSPRTVSYYFPAKEQVLFADDVARNLRLERWLGERDPAAQTTADAFRGWLKNELPGQLDFDRDETLRRRRVIDADSKLQDAERRYVAHGERALAEAFAADAGAPSALHAQMTAAALLAMVGVIRAEAGARLAADTGWDAAQVVDLLEDALRFVEAGLGELEAVGGPGRPSRDIDTGGL